MKMTGDSVVLTKDEHRGLIREINMLRKEIDRLEEELEEAQQFEPADEDLLCSKCYRTIREKLLCRECRA